MERADVTQGAANRDDRGGVMATVEEAIEEFRAGRFVIITDDESRENEGDLVIAADFANAESINFMAKYGRGLICMPMTGERLDELGIPMQVSPQDNASLFGTAFTVSVEARSNVTTGISAADRAETVRVLIDPRTTKRDLAMPGHLFPLRARDGGVLVRAGQTEAAVDLAKLAGLTPAGLVCEIMNEDGTMARLPDLKKFAEQHALKIISVEQMIAYRQQHERLVERVTETVIPTLYGSWKAIAYRSIVDPDEHVALVMGDVADGEPVLVRMLRLRRAARESDAAHRRRGPRRHRLHATGGTRHRLPQQAARLRSAGRRPRYGGSQRSAGL
jgi:3,4-dihydroxy 2-butanone 4-phosphate synthase/GTP cyclohydrolase II